MSPNPYDRLPALPSFTLTSPQISAGQPLPLPQTSALSGLGGEDLSPELNWSGAPEDTRSFVVTMFDPDAPTPAGFWHWTVIDIPAGTTGLPLGAGTPGSGLLPAGARTLRHDMGGAGYLGSAPPAGHGDHEYYVAVHAVDVPRLDIPDDATPTLASFQLFSHALARAVISAPYGIAAD